MLLRLFSVIAALLLATSVCAVQAASPPPVQAFFSYPQISDVQISPDGKYLAMVVADSQTGENRKGLVVLNLQSRKVTASFKTIGDQDINQYWWANDKRLLIATAIQTGSLDSPLGDGKLLGINVDGTQMEQLMGIIPGNSENFTHIHIGAHSQLLFFVRMLYIPPDAAKQVIVQAVSDTGFRNQPDQAYSLDIYQGNLRNVAQSPAANGTLLTDNAGEVRLAIGSNTLTGTTKLFYRAFGSDLKWKDLSALYGDDDPAMTPLEPWVLRRMIRRCIGWAVRQHRR
ncbi:MAG: hypothetical protein WBR15_01105 [Gammaproteobacteria bacterium]